MQKLGRSVTVVAAIVLSAFFLISFAKSAQAAGTDTIKIGYLGTLSGPFAAVERYMTPAVEMVIDDINAKGGLLGKKVELVTRDNQGDPSVVRQKLDELKAAGCVVMLGCILDPLDPPTSQWAADNKIPVIIPGTARFDMRTTGFNKYAFITGPAAPALANVLVRTVSKLDVKSIYSIGADSDVATDTFKFFWSAMKKANPNTQDLGNVTTGIAEMEFSNIISAALAKKPDLILLGIAGPPYANFVQQARRFNLFNKAKVAAVAYDLGAETTSAFGKAYPEGVMVSSFSPFWINDKPMQDFVKAHLARTKLYPADITMEWHIAALAAVAAIKRANSTDADKMVAALENFDFDTPVGKVHYRDFDHGAVMPIYMATSGFSKDYPIAIGLNTVKYGAEVYPTKAEILALRAAAK